MQKRCDALLSYEKKSGKAIIFVELKQCRGGNWKHDADDQLRETIDCFERSGEAKQYTIKKAYIANSLRPKFNEDDKIRKKKFYDDTKYSLEIKQEIQIDKEYAMQLNKRHHPQRRSGGSHLRGRLRADR
jgi:uncharacterized protein (DUF2147 family)